MPRKSQELRLNQARELYIAYEEAAVGGTAFRFLGDMISSMVRAKYPSSKQRAWLDKLIDEGVPVPKGDPARLQMLMDAVTTFEQNDKEWESNVLRDFASRERKGWDLSPKQGALLDRLLKQADLVRSGDHVLVVTPEMRSELETASKLYMGYSSMWRGDRPAVRKAVEQVRCFLAGTGYIEQYHYDKLTKAVGPKMKKFKSPRFFEGDVGFRGSNTNANKKMLLCLTDAFIDQRGRIVNDWVCPNGELVQLEQENVGKR
jgi:hypothetical protein